MPSKELKVISDYAKVIAANDNVTAKEAIAIIRGIFSMINYDLEKGNDVRINNFGTFKLKTRAARPERKGRNPRTGEELIIAAQPEREVITFKPSKMSK